MSRDVRQQLDRVDRSDPGHSAADERSRAVTGPTQGTLWASTLPTRVRLRRTRGWHLQTQAPGAIVVRRPSRYGNPFTVADMLADDPTLTGTQARAQCTRLFALWLDGELPPASWDLDLAGQWGFEGLHVHSFRRHLLGRTRGGGLGLAGAAHGSWA